MRRKISTKNKGQTIKLMSLFFVLCSLFVASQLVFAAERKISKKEDNFMQKKAYFAGGCFWCMEKPFEDTAGVISVDSGYVNSDIPNPTYEQVSDGMTGAYEAVEIIYDPSKVSYEDLLNVYWTTVDPTQSDGQFNDRGSQYLTGIFYQNAEEKMIAEESKQLLEEAKVFKKPITVAVLALKSWTRAEEYHQDYYKKNATHYNMYAVGSGRKGFLKETWKDKPYCPLRKISLAKVKEIQAKAKN